MDDTILRTERIILRYQRKSDTEYLSHLWIDEDMTRFTGGPREKAFLIDVFRKTGENPRELEYDLWVIELRSNHEIIGQAGFIPKIIKGKEYIELNYYIDKTKWRMGYGKEISKALLEYAFEIKKLDMIISIIDPQNEASIALAKSIGMKYWMNEEREERIKSIYVIEKRKAKQML